MARNFEMILENEMTMFYQPDSDDELYFSPEPKRKPALSFESSLELSLPNTKFRQKHQLSLPPRKPFLSKQPSSFRHKQQLSLPKRNPPLPIEKLLRQPIFQKRKLPSSFLRKRQSLESTLPKKNPETSKECCPPPAETLKVCCPSPTETSKEGSPPPSETLKESCPSPTETLRRQKCQSPPAEKLKESCPSPTETLRRQKCQSPETVKECCPPPAKTLRLQKYHPSSPETLKEGSPPPAKTLRLKKCYPPETLKECSPPPAEKIKSLPKPHTPPTETLPDGPKPAETLPDTPKQTRETLQRTPETKLDTFLPKRPRLNLMKHFRGRQTMQRRYHHCGRRREPVHAILPPFKKVHKHKNFYVLAVRKGEYVLTDGFKTLVRKDSVKWIKFLESDLRNACFYARHIFCADGTTRDLLRKASESFAETHPVITEKTKIEVLQPLEGRCEYCDREVCLRWLATKSGIQRFFNYPLDDVEH